MVNLLEINPETKKILHAPTLQIYLLKRISRNADQEKKKLYKEFKIWKKMSEKINNLLIPFENIYFDNKKDSVYLNLNISNCYPLKVC